jgi:hypothetical protein
MDTKARMHIFIRWSFILDPVGAIEKRSISQSCNFCSKYRVLKFIMPKFSSALPLTPFTSSPIHNSDFTANCSKIGFSRDSGFVVLAHLCLTFPSRPTNHFSKFHFTFFMPNNPGFSSFNHSKSGFALSPFTSVFPKMGKVTP